MGQITRSAWKQIISWSIYDWANSAFATSIMAAFFPVFFKQYWSSGTTTSESTLHLGVANSLVGLAVFLCAPILGAIADRGRTKKRLLGTFALLGAAATGALFFVGQGQWQWAALLYIIASIGYFGGNIFYDSLLVSVAPSGKLDFVSGLGFSIGYLGGGLLLALNILCVEQYSWFGFSDKSQAVQFAFMAVACWWALFSLPILIGVKETQGAQSPKFLTLIMSAFRQLRQTAQEISKFKTILFFLAGYFFYIDGVNTLVKMAVDYAMSLGLEGSSLIKALLLTQFVAFPAALLFAFIGERLGAKHTILAGIAIYIGILLWASQMTTTLDFYYMAGAVGCVQGGVQALSRSLYGQMVPKERAAEFFGFYNMVGKFSSILGPLLVGVAASLTNDPRLSLLIIILLFVIGAFFLLRVRQPPRFT